MPLTDRQKQAISKSLEKKNVRFMCPMCSHKAWSAGEDLVFCNTFSLGGGMGIGGPNIVPVLQLICTNCGFVSHHAVKILVPDLVE